jgi:hypothetical protein
VRNAELDVEALEPLKVGKYLLFDFDALLVDELPDRHPA